MARRKSNSGPLKKGDKRVLIMAGLAGLIITALFVWMD
ncbi:hypothetical protein AQ1_01018 [alpha proteobacterium Q-1]|nr:hypothetical protein AQ1_01018 [alpha proteobacterium Q-1]